MINLDTPQLIDPIWAEQGDIPEHINVVCVYWGDKYPKTYVDKMYNMVKRNMGDANYTFYCITDEEISDHINVLKPEDDWGTWWQKINLFNPNVVLPGKTLYIDIDSVITSDLTPIFTLKSDKPLIIIENPSPNKKDCAHNSSVMLFDSGDSRVSRIYEEFKKDSKRIMEGLHGDQCFYWRVLLDHISNFPRHLISSYKYHCRGRGLPVDTKVVFFHGKPDPDEVSDKWVIEKWI